MNPIWTLRLSSGFSGVVITLSPFYLLAVGCNRNHLEAFAMPDLLQVNIFSMYLNSEMLVAPRESGRKTCDSRHLDTVGRLSTHHSCRDASCNGSRSLV